MTLDKETPIDVLFVYRYLLDTPDPIQNLTQDVQDLSYFPERINGSYRAEWLSYVKKKLHALKQLPASDQTEFWQTLSDKMREPKQDAALFSALASIKRSQDIQANSNIAVIKIPVRTYIEQLIKL